MLVSHWGVCLQGVESFQWSRLATGHDGGFLVKQMWSHLNRYTQIIRGTNLSSGAMSDYKFHQILSRGEGRGVVIVIATAFLGGTHTNMYVSSTNNHKTCIHFIHYWLHLIDSISFSAHKGNSGLQSVLLWPGSCHKGLYITGVLKKYLQMH